MDKTRVGCVDKALCPPKSNVKVVNSMTNGGQYDIDSHVFCFYKTNFAMVWNCKTR